MNSLRIVLNQIKREITNVFAGAMQANLSRVQGQVDKTIYSIGIGEGTRVDTGRPLKSIAIRRELVLRIASEAKNRGIDLDEDLNSKAELSADIKRMIINIERNQTINEQEDIPRPVRYVGDDGVKELVMTNDSVSYETELRFRLETID